MCSPLDRDCIEGAIGQDFNCSVSCEGIYADVQWLGVLDAAKKKTEHQWTMLNGKMEKDEEILNKKKILALVNEYNTFKKKNVQHFKFSAEANKQSYGETMTNPILAYIYGLFLPEKLSSTLFAGTELVESTLQLVQIYFDTATFDEVERDKKIKTEAQLSLIGGTMGLLTGFSIISGFEIIFFLFRHKLYSLSS